MLSYLLNIMDSNMLGKYLILIGSIILLTGIVLLYKDVLPFVKYLGKLPGDIHIKKEHFSFYFPLTTSLLVSLAVSLFLFIVHKCK